MVNFGYFLLFLSVSDAAHILFTTMWQSKSHFGTMLPFMNRLVESGHQVAAYYEVSEADELPPNIENLLAVHGNKKLLESGLSPAFFDIMWKGEYKSRTIYLPWKMSALCHEEICNNHQYFWRVANITWDLLVVDSLFSVAGIDLSYRQKIPTVLFHTSINEFPMAYFRGKSWPMVTFPGMFFSHEIDTWTAAKFWDRFDSFYRNFEFLVTYFSVERLIQRFSTLGRFSWQEFLEKSPIGVYDQPDTIFTWPQPLTPETFAVASCLKFVKEPLPEQIEKFVSDPKSRGTILVAFGTVVPYNTMPKERFEAFVDGLKRLKEYRIIWAYKIGPKLELPSHILTLPWVPQKGILSHNATKLFVSHGGLKSLKETICFEVPAVYLPLFAEQVFNAFLGRNLGFGGYLNKKHLTADRFETEIRRALGDKSAYQNVKRAKRIWTDRIIEPLDLGAFWVHKVLRGFNDSYLKPKSVKLSTWHSANFDLLLCIFAFFSCLIFISA